eukprot:scaffold10935_cov33-Phaeocystis_antarctica.AAC.1
MGPRTAPTPRTPTRRSNAAKRCPVSLGAGVISKGTRAGKRQSYCSQLLLGRALRGRRLRRPDRVGDEVAHL